MDNSKNLSFKKSVVAFQMRLWDAMVARLGGVVWNGAGNAWLSSLRGGESWGLFRKWGGGSLSSGRHLPNGAKPLRFRFANLGLFLGGLFVFSHSPLQAALTWNYFTTDGNNSISGTFETDGSSVDLTGGGIHQFALTEFLSWYVNGVSVEADFQGNGLAAPDEPFPLHGNNVVHWDQDLQTVVNRDVFELSAVSNEFSIRSSWILINYPEQPAHPQSFISDNSDNNPSLIFIPTMTTITPVPEPRVWGAGMSLGLLLGALVRRRLSLQFGGDCALGDGDSRARQDIHYQSTTEPSSGSYLVR